MPYKRGDSKNLWINIAGVRRSSGTADWQRAKYLEDRGNAEAWDRKNRGVAPEKTWDEACLSWFEENQSRRSIRNQAYIAQVLKPKLTGMYLSEITKEFVHKNIMPDRVTKEPSKKNSTANQYVQFISKIIRHSGLTPPRFVRYAKPEPNERWLTADEWRQLSAVMAPDFRRMATFALSTGLRLANVTGLQWTWIKGDVLMIPSRFTKTAKPYTIPLNSTALAVLDECRKDPVRSIELAFLMNGREGYRVAVANAMRTAVTASGVAPLTFHTLRHTFASWLAQKGVPWEVVARLGCWKLQGMVNRYAHLSVEDLRGHSEVISTILTQHSQAIVLSA